MIATARALPPTPSASIVEVGKNCWRVEPADKFFCIQDAADYFKLVREALLAAEKTVFILGWDIFASVDLAPGVDPKGPARQEAPTKLDALLSFVARRRPHLRCYILIWDYAALYTLERDPFSRWKLGWRAHRHVRFGFDDRHPVGGSHHQKVVVVDDRLAFCGGIDLTSHRWDTSAHRIDEPARTSFGGKAYGPYHDVQTMLTGPAATALGELARDRWRALGEQRLPPVQPSSREWWPEDVTPDLTGVEVAIARTVPGSDTQPSVRECEALFLDSIAAAERSIYIESQYFTNERLTKALARRLREPHGPEVLIVSPAECHGWLEQTTMGAFRYSVFRQLIAADTYKRLRLACPLASRSRNVPTFVHSKVMAVDDTLVRIGSANFSNRSMGVDTECDVAVDATRQPDARPGIRRIRNRLLGEHLGLSPDEVADGLERAGSLCALIDSRQHADRTLVPIEIPPDEDVEPSDTARRIADPDEPIAFRVAVEELVPAADVTTALRPVPFPSVPLLVLAIAFASLWAVIDWRPEFRAVQDALASAPYVRWTTWATAAAVALAGVVFVPLELVTIASAVVLGGVRGAAAALLGALAGAALGYLLGRRIGPAGLSRWMSRRSYRSARQLGARGVMGVLSLRLASVATSGSINLLCGAGRVPFPTFMAGTLLAFIPAVAALSGVGVALRETLLRPSVSNALMTAGAVLLLTVAAAALRTLLLIRQFAPSVSHQRARAEFG